MSAFGKAANPITSSVRDIPPATLAPLVENGAVVVVDVREAHEFAAGHIPGAINLPLSGFSADQLPDSGGRPLVLNCAAGGRSARALAHCDAAQASVDGHLAGGMGAWMAAGLPVERGA